jgi:fluoroquinolone resistance protein
MSFESNSEYFSQSFDKIHVSGDAFSDITFENCSFKSCILSDTKFQSCKFIECTFTASNLSNINLSFSRFMDTRFEECKLVGVDWTKADWPRFTLSAPIAFSQCIMNDSSFFGLSLNELILEHCKAHEVDFRNGNFTKAKFIFSDLTNSLFSKTDLREADFSEAQNYRIDIFQNEIKGARFTRLEALSLLDSLEIELVD